MLSGMLQVFLLLRASPEWSTHRASRNRNSAACTPFMPNMKSVSVFQFVSTPQLMVANLTVAMSNREGGPQRTR